MPRGSSRLLGKPGPSWHDLLAGVYSSKLLLTRLARAGDLVAFGHQHSRVAALLQCFQYTLANKQVQTPENTRELMQTRVIPQLFAATSNGLRQLNQQWQSPTAAGPSFQTSVQAVSMLCSVVNCCSVRWICKDWHAVKESITSIAVNTGKYMCVVEQ